MIRSVSLALLGLLFLTTLAAGADRAGCGVRGGLYDEWLGKRSSARAAPAHGALVAPRPSISPGLDERKTIAQEYQNFFQCLSESAAPKDLDSAQSYCKAAEGDRLATLVCNAALHVKKGRTDGRAFLDALPGGKKGIEMIWDLDTIAGAAQDHRETAALFLPKGPAYKIIDELFLLVLDDQDTAAAKYFNLAASSTGEGARYMDDQIKLLMRESPAVIVKRWEIVRQHQPKLKKLLSEMAAGLPAAELKKMRQGIAAFCDKDNPDCPEIVRLFGRPD